MTSEAGYKAHALSHHSKAHVATELPDYERHDSPLPSPKSVTSADRLSRTQMGGFPYPDAPQPHPTDTDAEAEYDPRPSLALPRPPSGTRSDDTMWDGSTRRPTASTSQSQLTRNGTDNFTFTAPLFIDGTRIYVEEVPAPTAPPYPQIHPYVSCPPVSPVLVTDANRAGHELHVAHRSLGRRLMNLNNLNHIDAVLRVRVVGPSCRKQLAARTIECVCVPRLLMFVTCCTHTLCILPFPVLSVLFYSILLSSILLFLRCRIRIMDLFYSYSSKNFIPLYCCT